MLLGFIEVLTVDFSVKPGEDKMTSLVESLGPEMIWSRRKGCHHTLGDDHRADGKAVTTHWEMTMGPTERLSPHVER